MFHHPSSSDHKTMRCQVNADNSTVIQIPLTHGHTTIIDAEDFDLANRFRWYYAIVGYAMNSQKQYLHRLILDAKPGQMVDHINHDRLDNRRCNLRITNAQGNQRNRVKSGTTSSRFKGVGWSKAANKWSARIKINKKAHHLGLFDLEEDAAYAYNIEAVKLFGEFAVLNDVAPRDLPRREVKWRGVHYRKDRNHYAVYVWRDGKKNYVTSCDTAEEAARAYDAAAQQMIGSRAKLNFK